MLGKRMDVGHTSVIEHFFLGESWRLNTLADLSSKLRKTTHLISKFIYSNPTDYSVIDSHPAFRICAYKRKGVTTIKKALNFQSCANFSFHFVQGFFRFIWEPCYNAILAASCFFSSALLGVWITEMFIYSMHINNYHDIIMFNFRLYAVLIFLCPSDVHCRSIWHPFNSCFHTFLGAQFPRKMICWIDPYQNLARTW